MYNYVSHVWVTVHRLIFIGKMFSVPRRWYMLTKVPSSPIRAVPCCVDHVAVHRVCYRFLTRGGSSKHLEQNPKLVLTRCRVDQSFLPPVPATCWGSPLVTSPLLSPDADIRHPRHYRDSDAWWHRYLVDTPASESPVAAHNSAHLCKA